MNQQFLGHQVMDISKDLMEATPTAPCAMNGIMLDLNLTKNFIVILNDDGEQVLREWTVAPLVLESWMDDREIEGAGRLLK